MSILGSVDHIQGALDYHIARHNLLTANMAHVDTPGYKARDLYRSDPFSKILDVQLQANSPEHLGASSRPTNWRVKLDPNSQVGEDGNSVDLDREAVKVSANNIRYESLSTMIQGTLQAYEWAANDGK